MPKQTEVEEVGSGISGWEPTSGLADKYTLTITSATFGYDAKFMDGEQLLLIIEGDAPELEKGVARELYSIGKGWEAEARGSKIVRADGSKKGLNDSTAAWSFISNAIAAGAGDTLMERGTMCDAPVWEGLIFEMHRIETKGMNNEKKSRIVPAKFLGEVKSGGKSAKGKATAKDDDAGAAKAKATNAKAKVEDDDGDEDEAAEWLTPAIEKKLNKLAGTYDDFDDFYADAIEIKGVEDDEDVLRGVYENVKAED